MAKKQMAFPKAWMRHSKKYVHGEKPLLAIILGSFAMIYSTIVPAFPQAFHKLPYDEQTNIFLARGLFVVGFIFAWTPLLLRSIYRLFDPREVPWDDQQKDLVSILVFMVGFLCSAFTVAVLVENNGNYLATVTGLVGDTLIAVMGAAIVILIRPSKKKRKQKRRIRS